MNIIYERFLLSAGKCFKSKNKFTHTYGRAVVFVLSYIFHIKHYNENAIIEEIKLQVPQRSNDKKLLRKIKRAYFRYRCSAREYLVYDFENKSSAEIKSYLLDIEKIVLITLINNRRILKTLNAKQETYKVFKPYYKRDILYMGQKKHVSLEEFTAFARKHNNFICKPSNMSLGQGIKKYCINDFSAIGDIYKEMERKKPVVLEELLYNDDSLSAFYKGALNIVRVIVFRLKTEEIKIYRAYLSLGKGNKEYANAASGAIAVPIDIETGITNGIGVTEGFDKYTVHPDSGLELMSYQIQRWDELIDLVRKVSNIMPDVKYVGWDIALTPKGWAVIEGNGNAGQMLYQVMNGKSVYDEFMGLYMRT